MRKNTSMARSRRLRSNNQRRVLIKKLHHKVLIRRTQFEGAALNQELSEAC